MKKPTTTAKLYMYKAIYEIFLRFFLVQREKRLKTPVYFFFLETILKCFLLIDQLYKFIYNSTLEIISSSRLTNAT
jgi:hypothetical protein